MPRRPREQVPGRIYHVVARGFARHPIFRDDGDCQVYLVMLLGVINIFGWRVLAYCLMTNHVHVIVETPYPNLARGVQRLHGHYATFFNRRHDREGHLFERRYWDTPIKDDAHLQKALAYVAQNPVEAGICERPEDWRRSSYAASMGLCDDFCIDLARLRQLGA